MVERIAHQRSSVAGAVPDPAVVKVGEIIVNLADRTLRTKNGAGALIRVNQNFKISNVDIPDPVSGDAYLTTSGQIKVYADFGLGEVWQEIAPPEDLGAVLEKSGGTMTGQITLPGGGAGLQAITVDEALALAVAAAVPALLKAGGVMTGQITLPGGGTASQALQKSEIEALITAAIPPDLSGVLLKTGGVMTGQITLPGGGAGNQAVSVNELAAAVAAHAAQPDPHTAYTLTTELNAHIAAGGAQHPNATTSVAGFLSGADKTKLDSLVATPEATLAQWLANTADKVLTTDVVWSAGATVALTWVDSGNTAVNFSTFVNATLAVGGANSTLGAPTNLKVGQSGFIRITQHATTARILAFHSNWKFDAGADPALSTALGAVDILFYQVIATGFIYASLRKGVA